MTGTTRDPYDMTQLVRLVSYIGIAALAIAGALALMAPAHATGGKPHCPPAPIAADGRTWCPPTTTPPTTRPTTAPTTPPTTTPTTPPTSPSATPSTVPPTSTSPSPSPSVDDITPTATAATEPPVTGVAGGDGELPLTGLPIAAAAVAGAVALAAGVVLLYTGRRRRTRYIA